MNTHPFVPELKTIAMILDKAEKSIKYFEYKIKYAQNKKLHAEHLNNLIKLYNAYEWQRSQKPATMIRNLTMALYAELLKRYEDPFMALTYLERYIKFHHANKQELEEVAAHLALIDYKPNILQPVDEKEIYEITRRLHQMDDARQLALNDINRLLNL